MAFRFRRSIKILPGLKLNVNKKSLSVTVGGRGAHTTFGSRGTTTSVGVPGTSFSWSRFDKYGTSSATRRYKRVPARQAREMMRRALHTQVFALHDETMKGPVSLSLILRLIASRTYPEDTLIRDAGSDGWANIPEEVIDMARQYVDDEDGQVRLRWFLSIVAVLALAGFAYLAGANKLGVVAAQLRSLADPAPADAQAAEIEAEPIAPPIPAPRATPNSALRRAAAQNAEIMAKYGGK